MASIGPCTGGLAALTVLATAASAGTRGPGVHGATCGITASVQQVVSLSTSSKIFDIRVRRPGRYAVCVSEISYRSNGALRLRIMPRLGGPVASPVAEQVAFYYALLHAGEAPDRAAWKRVVAGNTALVEVRGADGSGEGKRIQLWLALESSEGTLAGEYACEMVLEAILIDHYDHLVP